MWGRKNFTVLVSVCCNNKITTKLVSYKCQKCVGKFKVLQICQQRTQICLGEFYKLPIPITFALRRGTQGGDTKGKGVESYETNLMGPPKSLGFTLEGYYVMPVSSCLLLFAFWLIRQVFSSVVYLQHARLSLPNSKTLYTWSWTEDQASQFSSWAHCLRCFVTMSEVDQPHLFIHPTS